MTGQTLFWIGFGLFVLLMLALDLGVLGRKSHTIEFREALIRSGIWIGTALIFNTLIWLFWPHISPGSKVAPHTAAMQFLTGYLLEYALSVDNIFVFLLIFGYFKIPDAYQHKVLFWGIIGALIFRAIFIGAGIALLERFHWMIYVFGGLLIYTGIRMVLEKDKDINPDDNPVLKLFRRVVPVTHGFVDDQFFTRLKGKLYATPLFVALLFIEITDIVFAVDSIPAILTVTREPFIVYTSNVFAILGLRSLYFALSGIMTMFHYLSYGLAAILIFVGTKMLISEYYKIPIGASLAFIALTLVLSIALSIKFPKPPMAVGH